LYAPSGLRAAVGFGSRPGTVWDGDGRAVNRSIAHLTRSRTADQRQRDPALAGAAVATMRVDVSSGARQSKLDDIA